MNRIILIGNGFDLAHGLKTSYKDFINDFWINEIRKSYDMKYLKTEVSDGKAYYIFEDEFVVAELKDFIDTSDKKNIDIFRRNIIQYKNKFLRTIEMELYEKKWCDIENLYYKELKRCLNLKKNENDDYSIKQLNDDFEAIRKKLEEYLTTEQNKTSTNKIPDIEQHLTDIKPFDTANKSYAKTLFLNFNYTNTETLYFGVDDEIIHIHGELNNNSMIFGYGDELDDDYKDIEKQDNKEFQENLKFISYLKTKNYEKLLNFMNDDDYEIYIFGHSCGNSDRTLLNFLFEEGCLKQCQKIRIFYHEDANGKSNYTDIIKDISKQFNKKSRLRELVVKEKPLKKPDVIKQKKELWEELEDNMVDVIVDKNCPAYLAIDDTISSKKDLDKNFKMSKFLVTQDLWESIMGKNKFAFPADKNPAESVSWDDICKKTGFLDKLNKKSRKQYRLPTEAEWEYAARGGIKSNNYEYAGCNLEEELKYYAWYEENSNNSTRPVGQLHPNELGLYDMSGNVWEWCKDSEGSTRVHRGGSWYDYEWSARVSDRNYLDPDFRGYLLGFRVACSSK